MAKTGIGEFVRQVRQEFARVTWPSRKEWLVTTGMVFVMVTVAALFFLITDQVIQFGLKLILGLGS